MFDPVMFWGFVILFLVCGIVGVALAWVRFALQIRRINKESADYIRASKRDEAAFYERCAKRKQAYDAFIADLPKGLTLAQFRQRCDAYWSDLVRQYPI